MELPYELDSLAQRLYAVSIAAAHICDHGVDEGAIEGLESLIQDIGVQAQNLAKQVREKKSN
jgi:hypothetical protein